MKRDWLWISLIVLVVLVLVAMVIPVRETEDTVKIGAIVPLTGNYATLGTRIRNGMELARIELEDENNISIKVYYEDVCFGKDAVLAVQKLINVNGISWIGGSFCVIGLIPNIPILEKEKIISFNTAANPDVMLNHPYVFSTNKAIKYDATEMADFAINELDAKTVSVIYYNTPLGVDYGKYFGEKFRELGGEVLSDQPYELSQNEFMTELTRIKSENPDLIFAIGLSGQMGNFLKGAKELGIDSQVLSFSEIEDPSMLEAAGGAAEGLIISAAEPPVKTEKMKKFQEDYMEMFGEEADVLAANAYDALNIQILAYLKCDKKVECMKDELHLVKDYPGVSGIITIQEDGSSEKSTLYKIVENGKFVPYN